MNSPTTSASHNRRFLVRLTRSERAGWKESALQFGEMRDRLASWLNDIDPQATVLPEREAMETGSSLLFVMTASRWAAMRLRVLPFTWSSVVSEVQKAPEERHYQSGDIIAPTGR